MIQPGRRDQREDRRDAGRGRQDQADRAITPMNRTVAGEKFCIQGSLGTSLSFGWVAFITRRPEPPAREHHFRHRVLDGGEVGRRPDSPAARRREAPLSRRHPTRARWRHRAPEEDEGVGRAALVIDVRLLLLTSAARLPEHAGAVGDPVVQRGLHMNDDLPHAATPGSTWPQPAFADGGMLWLWWNVFCGS